MAEQRCHTGSEPAFPHAEDDYDGDAEEYLVKVVSAGLTKRELFAALIMQGLVQDPNMTTMRRAAEGAVEGADALIAALSDDRSAS